jgi:4-hydroxy-tetrahydrodipicolinate synthase
MRRGLLASAAMRQPAAMLTPTAQAEVEHLLARLARRDGRASLAPV